MKTFLRLEEAVLLLAGVYLFSFLPYGWWLLPVLLLAPDLSMLGYLVNQKLGAYLYNIFHTRITALLLIMIGVYMHMDIVILAGVVLFCHSAMDRMLHYGLKYTDSFKHTHLGTLK